MNTAVTSKRHYVDPAPFDPGATEPVARSRAHQRTALDALTPNRAAAARHETPAATARTTRSRRSIDRALDIACRPPHRQPARITSEGRWESLPIQSGRNML